MKKHLIIAALMGLSLSAAAGDKVEYGQLPEVVQKAVNASRGTDTLKGIEKQVTDGKTVYEVEFDRPGLNRKVWIAEDGSNVRDSQKPALSTDSRVNRVERTEYVPLFERTATMTLSDVPEPVRKTIEQQAAGRKVADIDKETWNKNTVYEVEFAQAGRNQQIHVAEDGTIVRDDRLAKGLKNLFMGTQIEDTPAAVQETIQRVAGGQKIADIDKETRTGQVVYEVEIDREGRDRELHIAENGTILRDSDQKAAGAPERQVQTGTERAASAETLTLEQLPAAVRNRIRASDPGATVSQIHRTARDGKIAYEVELQKEGKSTKLFIAEDGTILKLKEK